MTANSKQPGFTTRRQARSHPLFARITRGHSQIMRALCIAAAVAILATLAAVLTYLLSIGIGSLSLSFFTKLPIPHGMEGAPGGMQNAVVGTLILIGLASCVGIPVGMLAGIFLSEYEAGSKLASPARLFADVLGGVPSIVIGILGYELVVVPMGHFNGYAGALALAFIMIPIIARTTEEMLKLVPNSYREASIGLGATKAQMIFTVVLPAATGSMVTGIVLAIARVAGETAPLLFTALGSRLLTTNPNQPFPSLTVQIFSYATGPYPEERKLAWAGILVLIALLFVINILIRLFVAKLQRRMGSA